jgi:hypothetical protein
MFVDIEELLRAWLFCYNELVRTFQLRELVLCKHTRGLRYMILDVHGSKRQVCNEDTKDIDDCAKDSEYDSYCDIRRT